MIYGHLKISLEVVNKEAQITGFVIGREWS